MQRTIAFLTALLLTRLAVQGHWQKGVIEPLTG
jgi:hypothetical protein